jgi:mannose-6-phosphate isomerase-like protein (cupin superfamily)
MTDYRTQPTEAAVTHVEEAQFPPLAVVDFSREAASVEQAYKNVVALKVNDHCVRLAVVQGEFRWHRHLHSDECFLVLEGELEVDLDGGQLLRLRPGQALTIPAGVVHRTRSLGRTVNLCFEDLNAYTDVVFEEPSS